MEYLDIVDENNEFTGIVEERKKHMILIIILLHGKMSNFKVKWNY